MVFQQSIPFSSRFGLATFVWSAFFVTDIKEIAYEIRKNLTWDFYCSARASSGSRWLLYSINMAEARKNYIRRNSLFDDRESAFGFIRMSFSLNWWLRGRYVHLKVSSRRQSFDMTWELTAQNQSQKWPIMVSKVRPIAWTMLLYRFPYRQLNIDVTVIISNHPDLEETCENWHGIPITTCLSPQRPS